LRDRERRKLEAKTKEEKKETRKKRTKRDRDAKSIILSIFSCGS